MILRVLDEGVELHFKEVLEQHGIEINSLQFKAFICWYIANIHVHNLNWTWKIGFLKSFLKMVHLYCIAVYIIDHTLFLCCSKWNGVWTLVNEMRKIPCDVPLNIIRYSCLQFNTSSSATFPIVTMISFFFSSCFANSMIEIGD